MLWFFSLAWNCSPEYWDDNICKFSCLSLYYPTPRMTDTSPSSQFAIFIFVFVFVFVFVYNHLVILLTPVHRRGWESPKTRMMGDWSHLLISQWLIFVFLPFLPFFSDSVPLSMQNVPTTVQSSQALGNTFRHSILSACLMWVTQTTWAPRVNLLAIDRKIINA